MTYTKYKHEYIISKTCRRTEYNMEEYIGTNKAAILIVDASVGL